jgi:serine/threonine protein kinase/tetratricopeptide (TPR) repeat protein
LGPFELETIIGSGGMGAVWKGRHEPSGLDVAVKVLTDARHRDNVFMEAFENEVRAVASLNHSGIVSVLDYGEITADTSARSEGALEVGSPYLVMEYAERGSLNRFQRGLGWAEYRVVLYAVLDALAHAHASDVLHRDLKPANILVGCGGLHPGIKLTDFGLAHALDRESPDELTRRGWGTPHYMSPEQFRGAWRNFGPWTDLYSFGVMAFELAVGEHPYQATTSAGFARAHTMGEPRPFAPKFDLPEGFEDWLLTLLQKEPGDRFQRAADAAYALSQLGDPPEGGGRTFTIMPIPDAPIASDETTEEPEPSLLDPGVQTRRRMPEEGFDPGADTLVDEVPSTQKLRSGTPHIPTEALEPEAWADDAGHKGGALRGASGKVERRAPPLPWTWKRPERRRVDRALLGAGLGLFGLMRIPVVGREDERDVIWESLKKVRETGRAHAVLLSGPAGTGKSRLAQWVSQRAHEVGSAEKFRAFNDPVAPSSEAIRQMLTLHMRCAGLDDDERIDRIRTIIRPHVPDPDVEAEALGALLRQNGAAPDDPTNVMLQPEQRQGLVRRHIKRATRHRPAVIWFDDVQWGAESLLIAASLLDADEPIPTLIVMTARTEALKERAYEHALVRNIATRPNVRVVRLDPLDTEETQQLVRELLHLSGDLADSVVERSQGNPLFAVQLVGDWVSNHKLAVGTAGFELRPGVRVDVPEDIFELWHERLEHVLESRDERLLLEIGAALGQRVSPHEWREACQQYGAVIPRGFLQRLTLAGLLNIDDDDWSFAHGMLRESLERSARDGNRWKAIHYACARMLDERYRIDRFPFAERRAIHLCEADRLSAAIEPLLDAARHRAARSEFDRADELIRIRESALMEIGIEPDRPSWGEGWMLRAELMMQQGQLRKAYDMAERVFVDARRYDWDGLVPRALLLQGVAEQESGRLDAATRLFERAKNQFDDMSDTKGEARCLEGLARVSQYRGELDEANQLFEQALELFVALEEPLGVSRCINGMGDVARRSGHYREARNLANDAMRRAESMNHQLGVADAISDLAELDRLERNFELAERGCRHAMRLYESLGSDRAMEVRANLGQAIVELGRFAEARQLFDEARRYAEEVRDEDLIARTNVALLAPLGFLGDWDEWRKRFDEANRLLLRLKFRDPNIAAAAAIAADVARRAGREDLALEAEAMRDEQS